MSEQEFFLGKSEYSVALIGKFNPSMFNPEWFCKNNVISQEDVDFAQSQQANFPCIVTPQITIFKTSQFYVRIEEGKIGLILEKEPYVLIKDFLMKTFENLGSITITAFGFNYDAHYKIASSQLYQKIGDRLAPKSYWEMLLGDEIKGDNRQSGLIALQMRKNKSDGTGYIQFKVSPSNLFIPGVILYCNDHYVLSSDEQSAEDAIRNINVIFDNSFQTMKELHEDLLRRVIQNG